MQQNSISYVFDLDGVITTPKDSSVNKQLLHKIHDMLESGMPIAINTGRSYKWVEENLVDFLKEQDTAEIFDKLIIICEKGGKEILWKNSELQINSTRVALNYEFYETTKKIFEDNKDNLSTMFWDVTKNTMASIEKYPEADLEEFHKQQKNLVKLLESNLDTSKARIEPTVIATDIESEEAGKYIGAELIYKWIKQNRFKADEFICFGDSLSDYEMARFFADKNEKSTFVYVGWDVEELENNEGTNIILPDKKFDEGTLEYFSKMQSYN